MAGPLPPAPPVPPADFEQAPPPPTGSLWRPALSANYPVLDVKAHFPGDLLTVVIAEESRGKKEGSTEAAAESSILAKVTGFFGIPAAAVSALPSGFNPEQIISAETRRESVGEATTERRDSLTGSITVQVVSVDGAGNLSVRGDKVVRLNREDQYIVLTGVVRPVDILPDNTVPSTRLADARISSFGRGVVSDKTGVPLVHRLMDWVWPF